MFHIVWAFIMFKHDIKWKLQNNFVSSFVICIYSGILINNHPHTHTFLNTLSEKKIIEIILNVRFIIIVLLRFRICIVINPCKCMFRNLCKFRQKICEIFCIKMRQFSEYSLVYLHLSHWWHAEHAATFKQSNHHAGIGKLLSWP